jgi:hypothetical protein
MSVSSESFRIQTFYPSISMYIPTLQLHETTSTNTMGRYQYLGSKNLCLRFD